jgi:iron(III) transport system permease protein
MALVLALHLLRIFQSFEVEQLLGVPFGFYVYSTRIFDLIQSDPPNYPQAAVLASMTLIVLALILPVQRRLVERARYTTISSSFKPGLIGLGKWRRMAFAAIALLLVLLTVIPLASLVVGSFMTRAGVFALRTPFTTSHWLTTLSDPRLLNAVRLTLIIAGTAAIVSPLLFSIVAYVVVRTRFRGRSVLDFAIWLSGALPGVLVGLGMLSVFLSTPGLQGLFGSIWALLIVVVLRPATLSTNVVKGVLIQVSQDLEDAARTLGAGWLSIYWRIWIPLLTPILVVLAMMTFVLSANATSEIILVASQSTNTMSLLALQLASSGYREQASIISILLIALTLGTMSVVRYWSGRIGIAQSTDSLLH